MPQRDAARFDCPHCHFVINRPFPICDQFEVQTFDTRSCRPIRLRRRCPSMPQPQPQELDRKWLPLQSQHVVAAAAPGHEDILLLVELLLLQKSCWGTASAQVVSVLYFIII
jgi:hypothetical protein